MGRLRLLSASTDPYQRKTDLARALIERVIGWLPERQFSVALDQGYANETVMRGLPARITCFGAMRTDAALTALPVPGAAPDGRRKAGRPRVRGERLPTPQQLAADGCVAAHAVAVRIDGRNQTVQCKTLLAQWYQACGGAMLRVVAVKMTTGKMPLRAYFATDPTLTAAQVLNEYANRWSIECTFKDLKQRLGFAEPQCRVEQAVKRIGPFVAYLFSLLVLWFAGGAWQSPLAKAPLRPWYSTRRDASFTDILRAARRALTGQNFVDLANRFDNLHEPRRAPPKPATTSPPTSAAGLDDAA